MTGPDPRGLAAPVPAADTDDNAGLFGAAAGSGRFDPVPVVTIAGRVMPTGLAGEIGQVVLDGLSVSWGREDLLAQPDPATGRLQVFDATNRWATATDLRGQPVTLGYTGHDPATGATESSTFFQGRIGHPVQIAPKTVRDPATGDPIRGTLVTLPLQSILIDLANTTPLEAWPQESMNARRQRIAAAAAAALPRGLTLRPSWLTAQVEPVPADRQRSLLEHLLGVYDSAGADRMTHVPSVGQVSYVARRVYPAARGLAQLWWNQASENAPRERTGQGAYLRSMAVTPAGGVPGIPNFLDAAVLESDPADGLTQSPKITRAQVAHPDASDPAKAPNYPTRVVEFAVPGANETATGTRVARLASIVLDAGSAAVAAGELRDLVAQEGAAWRVGAVRYRTRGTDGFPDRTTATLALLGAESGSLVFLERSWLARYGIRPVFGIMGGTIAYRDGGWDVELVPAPVTTVAPQHRLSAEDLAAAGNTGLQIQAWDRPHQSGFHESLTWEDLAYCAADLTGQIGPDTGWDIAQ